MNAFTTSAPVTGGATLFAYYFEQVGEHISERFVACLDLEAGTSIVSVKAKFCANEDTAKAWVEQWSSSYNLTGAN